MRTMDELLRLYDELTDAEKRQFLSLVKKRPKGRKTQSGGRVMSITLQGETFTCDSYPAGNGCYYVFDTNTLDFLGLYNKNTEELDVNVQNPYA
jgi:hypothetical protein